MGKINIDIPDTFLKSLTHLKAYLNEYNAHEINSISKKVTRNYSFTGLLTHSLLQADLSGSVCFQGGMVHFACLSLYH